MYGVTVNKEDVWTPERFKEWRADKEWSMRQAAFVIGVSKPTIVAWESKTKQIDDHASTVLKAIDLLQEAEAGDMPEAFVTQLRATFASLNFRLERAKSLPKPGRPINVDDPDGLHDKSAATCIITHTYHFIRDGQPHERHGLVEGYAYMMQPTSSFATVGFYLGKLRDGHRTAKRSPQFSHVQEAETWLEENGPDGHELVRKVVNGKSTSIK